MEAPFGTEWVGGLALSVEQVEQVESVVDDPFGDREPSARPLPVDGLTDAPGEIPRFSHTCGLFWGGHRPEVAVRALLEAVSAGWAESSLAIVGDPSLEPIAGQMVRWAREDAVSRLAVRSGHLTFLSSWAGTGTGGGDPAFLEGCLAAERQLSNGSAGGSEPPNGSRAGYPVTGVTSVCLHDLALVSGRDLVRLLRLHDHFVVGSRVLGRSGATGPEAGAGVGRAPAPASGSCPVLVRTHQPGCRSSPGSPRLCESQLAYIPGGEDWSRPLVPADSMITLLLGGILGCVDDRRRALELAAGLVAASTGATLCAIGLREGATFAAVGEKAGLPLRAEREIELACFFAGQPPRVPGRVFDIWGYDADPIGYALVDHFVWQEGGGATGDQEWVVAAMDMLGSWLEAQTSRNELRIQAAEQEGLRTRLAEEESARLLLTRLSRHLATLDVDALLDDLGGALGGEAALVSANGVVLAGSAAAAKPADGLGARSPWRRTAPERRGSATLVPLESGEDGTAAYLVLTGPTTAVDGVARESLEHLLSAAAALRLEGLDATFGSEPAFVLAALLSGEDFPQEELLRWARRLGIDLSAAHRVAFLSQAPGHPRGAAEVLGSIRSLLQARWEGVRPRLAAGRDGVVCLCADPEGWDARRWVEAWGKVLGAARSFGVDGVAIGGALTGLSGIRRSYQQSRSLARFQRAPGWAVSVPDVAVYEEGGLAEIILAHPDRDNLLAYVKRVLGPLLDDSRCGGQLPRTLQVYLATGGSPAQTAELLHLCPSSVKYRLRMIRELVPSDHFENHNRRFELEFALRVLDAVGDAIAPTGPETAEGRR